MFSQPVVPAVAESGFCEGLAKFNFDRLSVPMISLLMSLLRLNFANKLRSLRALRYLADCSCLWTLSYWFLGVKNGVLIPRASSWKRTSRVMLVERSLTLVRWLSVMF